MIWTRQEEEEEERIKHAEYVAQWEQENARVLPRTDDLADPNPPPRVMMSAHTLWRANRRSPFPSRSG